MSRNQVHWLAIIIAMVMSNAGISQEVRQARSDEGVRELVEALLPPIEDFVRRQYKLDESEVVDLSDAISAAMDSSLEHEETRRAFHSYSFPEDTFRLLAALISDTAFKTAMAKHLSDDQMNDFVAFAKLRAEQDQRAVSQLLTAWLD